MIQCRTPTPPSSVHPFDAFAAAILPPDSDRAGLRPLRDIGVAMALHAGRTARLDENGSHVAFLAQGAGKLVAYCTSGREQVLSFHFPGDLVSVPARGLHGYALVALQDARLIVFPEDAFLAHARREGGFGGAVLARVMVALGRYREKSLLLGRKTAGERVATFLATMVARIGEPAGTGWDLRLPMTRRDIADSLGMTIETVSRQFSELRASGLIATSGRRGVRVIDLARLEARAGYLDLAPSVFSQFALDQ